MTLLAASNLKESFPSVGESLRGRVTQPSTLRQQHWRVWVKSSVLSESNEIAERWRSKTLSRVRNLRWLNAGWDGPDSVPISMEAIEVACVLVSGLADVFPNLPPPTVTPTPYFGVYIEWSTLNSAVAFTVQKSGVIELDYENAKEGIAWEGDLSESFSEPWHRILLACSQEPLRT